MGVRRRPGNGNTCADCWRFPASDRLVRSLPFAPQLPCEGIAAPEKLIVTQRVVFAARPTARATLIGAAILGKSVVPFPWGQRASAFLLAALSAHPLQFFLVLLFLLVLYHCVVPRTHTAFFPVSRRHPVGWGAPLSPSYGRQLRRPSRRGGRVFRRKTMIILNAGRMNTSNNSSVLEKSRNFAMVSALTPRRQSGGKSRWLMKLSDPGDIGDGSPFCPQPAQRYQLGREAKKMVRLERPIV